MALHAQYSPRFELCDARLGVRSHTLGRVRVRGTLARISNIIIILLSAE